ncbi:hypothetical protein [Streptomyces sp. NPDC058268]|uniref:hypothetical protein n=1 Tax=Streptomyces sp. NPDC058268 TaxID=3346413 RepID=UPI0036EEEB9D
MARIQILELPTEHHGDDMITPFAVIVDQVPKGDDSIDPAADYSNVAKELGARAIMLFHDTVDIPANEVPVDPDGYPLQFRVEGDFEKLHEQTQDEILKAQARMRDAGLGRRV